MIKKNMEELKKHYPYIYSQVTEQSQNLKYTGTSSKNGMPNLFLENNNYLHSKYDPDKEVQSWVNGLEIAEQDTIVIVGMGLGYYMKYINKNYPTKNIIIIEPDLDIFMHAISTQDLSSYFKQDNIVFFVNTSCYAIENVIGEYLYENKIKHLYLTEMPVYRKIYKEYIEELYKSISKAILRVRGNLGTEMLSANMWLNNTIRNIPYILENPTIDNISGLGKDVPIVIVSAGPSLEKNMHYLRDIYDKAIIIAVGSAVNILEKHNIVPHIVMGIDGKEFEARIFSALQNTEPLMVYANSIHYKALEVYQGKKLWILLQTETYMKSVCEKLGINTKVFLTGPSVANTALDFACKLNPSAVMLIGQDLAYTNEKRYAAGNAHSDEDLSVFEKNSKYVKDKDIYGDDIYTKLDFIAMKDWFEDYVNIYGKAQKIYNCTEGGLNIAGIPNLPFNEAIDQLCTSHFDIKGKLDSIVKEPTNIEKEVFDKLINEYTMQINEGFELSRIRINLLGELLASDLNIAFEKKFNAIQKLGRQLEKLEAYNILIEETGTRYKQALRGAFENRSKGIDESNLKKKTMLNGLLHEFRYIHMNLETAKSAFDGKDIRYSC